MQAGHTQDHESSKECDQGDVDQGVLRNTYHERVTQYGQLGWTDTLGWLKVESYAEAPVARTSRSSLAARVADTRVSRAFE